MSDRRENLKSQRKNQTEELVRMNQIAYIFFSCINALSTSI
jgi:hypothetical protein